MLNRENNNYRVLDKRPPAITITPAALEEMAYRVQNPKPEYINPKRKKEDFPPIGIRIKVDNTGCSGNKYVVEYAYKKSPNDEEWDFIVNDYTLKILVDPATLLRILGSKVDYETDILRQEFIFKNPNEKGRCGCGESFY